MIYQTNEKMKATKLTPGEQLFEATNMADFWIWLADKKEQEKKIKAEKKAYWDAKYRANAPVIEKEEKVVINQDAPKYHHNRFGVGVLICEDETTITLSFGGGVKKMVKAFTKLTLI